MTVIGIISDTHGLLRPEASAALAGADHIIHAGDVGDPAILDVLGPIAPLTAIRGNIDRGPWAQSLPQDAVLQLDGVSVYVLHDFNALDLDPAAAGFAVVVSGHSHRPSIARRGPVLFINPGAAGPRRFSLPVTVARLAIEGGVVTPEIIDLLPTPPR